MSSPPNDENGRVIAAAFALLQGLPPSFRAELRHHGGASVLFLLEQAMETTDSSSAKRFVKEAYDRAWEKLHCGSWKSIHRVWRQAFGFASVLNAQHLSQEGRLTESLKSLDMCLMMAGPYAIPHVHKMIEAVERAIHKKLPCTSPRGVATKKRRLLSPRSDSLLQPTDSGLTLQFPVQRIALPSLETFHREYMLTGTPVIITGAMASWPAMGLDDPSRSWQEISYFRRVAGHRTVPIEVGSSYLEDDWGQQLMTMNEFIDRFLEPYAANQEDDRPIGYLAQHHLFEQIPALRKDIMTPDYCTLQREGAAAEDDDDITVNAWFGPQNTVSPLHFDPKDNLLCQVVGSKYLRLYAPAESDKLYPVEGLLSNTSQVDVEHADPIKFPRFQAAPYTECVLHAGEMLFIPPRYWHFVRSLSTSFSVSFWWS